MAQITAIAIAEPKLKISQRKSLEFVLASFPSSPAAQKLYKKVFSNKSISTRRFAVDKIAEVLEDNLDKVYQRYEKNAVDLSARSLKIALAKAGVPAKNLDFLAVSTCTGYICPGIASQLVEACGLRRDIHYVDIVGMGCGGALPAIEQCHNYLSAHPGHTAAVVATEICSAAISVGESADLIISNAIFGDGSAALILEGNPKKPSIRVGSFISQSYPAWKENLRFKMRGGRLRNVLSRDVPQKSGLAVRETVGRLLKIKRLASGDIRHWAVHSGGEKILNEIEQALALHGNALAHAREILREYGNLSSPSILYVLNRLIMKAKPRKGDLGVMVTFGAGFAVHAALLEF